MHHKMSISLQGVNIFGLVVWAENTQNFFGAIGAILGALSGLMIVVINWERFKDKFVKLPPVQWVVGVVVRWTLK